MAAFTEINGVTKITGSHVDGTTVTLFEHHNAQALQRVKNRIPPCTANTFRLKDVFGAADGANTEAHIGIHCRGYTSTITARLTDTVEDLRAIFTQAGFTNYFPKPRATMGGVLRSWQHGIKQLIGCNA